MGGLISKLFRRGDSKIEHDARSNIIVSAVHGDMARGDTESDLAWKKNLEIRYEVLHDEDVEDMLAEKCLKPIGAVPATDEKGNFVYVKDKNGNVQKDDSGQPLIEMRQGYIVDNTFAALRTMISHVNRCTFLDPKNTRLVQLVMEDIVEDAKMSLPEKDFDLGLGSYLDSLWNNMFFLTNDAQNGNKVKALLEIRTIKTLDVNTMQQKQKGAF